MSQQLLCDKCKTTIQLDPDKAYDAFPEGWVNVTLRHEGVKPHEYRDYCCAKCAIDALMATTLGPVSAAAQASERSTVALAR